MSECEHCGQTIRVEYIDDETGPCGAHDCGYRASCDCAEGFEPGQPPCEEGNDERAVAAALRDLSANADKFDRGAFRVEVYGAWGIDDTRDVLATTEESRWSDAMGVVEDYAARFPGREIAVSGRGSEDGSRRAQLEAAIARGRARKPEAA